MRPTWEAETRLGGTGLAPQVPGLNFIAMKLEGGGWTERFVAFK